MPKLSIAARIAGLAATAGLALSPLSAEAAASARPKRTVPITLPLSYAPVAPPIWTIADETAANHRWRRYRHHDGIDGGDVLAGILVLGGIAAIASSIDKSSKQSRRERDDRDRPYDYRDGDRRDDDYGRSGPRAMDRAVDACVAEAGRRGRVDEIFEVVRRDDGWRVKGDYANGREFTCTVDRDGRADLLDGGQADSQDGDEDDRYAAAAAPELEDAATR